ncbi:MAG: SAP domain-containing protein, partial [Candidatus Thalassarchaeaceae archaeon]|nr:SAP domain-containing protein [Candidatus Thalassarchaeaceae archaeon]
MDRDSLSSMKVSQLRILCKDKGLLVSGNKEALITRILEDSGISASLTTSSDSKKELAKDDRDAAIDRLLARVEGGGSSEEVLPTPPPPSTPDSVSVDLGQIPKKPPELPENGLPDGWNMEQWMYYGHQWLEKHKPESDVVEAEVFEADIIDEETPETESLILDEEDEGIEDLEEDPWTTGVIDERETALLAEDIQEDSDASITITIPSLSSINLNPKQIAAITAVLLILVAGGFALFLQKDSSFQARELRYGDSMQFNIESSSINIEGDDMVALFRDAAGGTLDDACGELEVDISTGSGSISIFKGDSSEIIHPSDSQFEGAVGALDAFGRSHLTAEKVISHSMVIDLSGKTWRSSGDCGNTGWILEDNTLDINTHSWSDINDRELVRSTTDLTFRDSDNAAINLEAVTFGLEEISGLGIAGEYITFPLTPIDLYEFFGEQKLTAGSSSQSGEAWKWSVSEEINDGTHGLVYPITMSHQEFDDCNGHVQIDLLVKNSVPWPVQQSVSIVIDKSQKNTNCGLIESSISDAAIPDGRATILVTMKSLSTTSGDKKIDWLADYQSKPGPGEDRPSTNSERPWSVYMPDESEIRDYNLEEAMNCMMANQSSSGAAQSIEQGGYIWKASTTGSSMGHIDWNLSWVNDDNTAGWTVI